MDTDQPLRGRVALVTGAAGGIGRATARLLADAGARLALTDLDAAGLPDVEDALTHAADLTDARQVEALFEAVDARFGRVDVVVNAAGLLRTTPFSDITKEEWDRVMDVNGGSAFLVCQEACRRMRDAGWGRIILLSSVAGQVGGFLAGAHYAASKAAVISLARSVTKLMAPHGVTCNAIAPSGVETEMLHTFTAEQRETLRRGIPVGRFGTPEEIAGVVLWLASPAADYITGQTIGVNGGAYLG